MRLKDYIAKRIMYSLFVLFGLSIFIFTISRLIPGDPARISLGPGAPEWAVEELRNKLHLNEPIHIQYVIWLTNALKGDLGMSLVTKRPVMQDFLTFFPATLELVIFSVLLSFVVSIVIGSIAGRRANSRFDNAVRVFSYLGIAIPNFVWAIIFLFLFGYVWKILPTLGQLSIGIKRPAIRTGMMLIDSLLEGDFNSFIDHFRHIILPSAVMSIERIAQDTRILRSGIVENLEKDYVTVASSFGIPEYQITMKYLLKPSLIPLVSIMGMETAYAIGGSFIIETIFCWPGFGKYAMWAMLNKDLNPIVAAVMFVGLACTFINILVDIIVAYLDPRILVTEKNT